MSWSNKCQIKTRSMNHSINKFVYKMHDAEFATLIKSSVHDWIFVFCFCFLTDRCFYKWRIFCLKLKLIVSSIWRDHNYSSLWLSCELPNTFDVNMLCFMKWIKVNWISLSHNQHSYTLSVKRNLSLLHCNAH